MHIETGKREHERLATAHRLVPRWSETRGDWLDALELALGSRAEAAPTYEVGLKASCSPVVIKASSRVSVSGM